MSGAPAAATSLAPALRSLRLTGMLETLETRLAEARSGRLGHAEFLQVLCEDEIARREASGVQRRLKAARFPTETTFEAFDFSYNAKLPQAQIRDLQRLEFIEAGEGVICYGPVGPG
jgi:DNA replication protein DnaC